MIGHITSITHAIHVPDLADAERWYRGLLGRQPDLRPVPGIAEWELASGAWLQIGEASVARTGPEAQLLRIGVEDLDATVDRLRDADIDVAGPETVPEVISFCEFEDPFGNRLSLYQVL